MYDSLEEIPCVNPLICPFIVSLLWITRLHLTNITIHHLTRLASREDLSEHAENTQQWTAENDNDKTSKYFRIPADALKEKYSAAQSKEAVRSDGSFPRAVASSEGNELIEKLKQASVDNKDNDRIIRAKTLANDLVRFKVCRSMWHWWRGDNVWIRYVACCTWYILRHRNFLQTQWTSFGPLLDTDVILNPDGENCTFMKAPQAMQLKKASYIKEKRFVTFVWWRRRLTLSYWLLATDY